MKNCFVIAIAIALSLNGALANFAWADKGDGKSKPVRSTVPGHPLKEIWSGYHFLSKELQGMQDDDIENPGMHWYDIGEVQWNKPNGQANKACATCHNKAEVSMKGVGVRYPVYNKLAKKLINIENRINFCREKFMKAPPFAYGTDELIGLTTYVRAQSRGLPVKVKTDGPVKPFFEKGRILYYTRRGQFDMACSHCHEKYYGKQMRMSKLSQGQSNGYPAYRLSWERPGSLHRRFATCDRLVRAEPLPLGGEDYINLELYLAWRSQGLPVETPAVRK